MDGKVEGGWNIWDVDVGSFLDSLVVNFGVSDDDYLGFFERLGDVVSEGIGGELVSDSLGIGEGVVFEDGMVVVGLSRDDIDVVGVFDGSEDMGSKDEFFLGFVDVDNVDIFVVISFYLIIEFIKFD